MGIKLPKNCCFIINTLKLKKNVLEVKVTNLIELMENSFLLCLPSFIAIRVQWFQLFRDQ